MNPFAVEDLQEMWDGLDSKFYRLADFFEVRAPTLVDHGIAATVAVVAVVCALGIVADLSSRFCSKSWAIFNLTSVLGVLVILALGGLVALELSLSVVFADFCAAGVDSSFLNLASQKMALDEATTDLVT